MNPRPIRVEPKQNNHIAVYFTNGECRQYDATSLLDKGIFIALKDPIFFSLVRIENNTISWPGGLDICPDTIYEDSVPYNPDSLRT